MSQQDSSNFEGIIVSNEAYVNYIDHEPITINSNDDFITYGFSGNGTGDNPYIIENYRIIANAEYGIKICCIDKSYIIKNCYIDLDYNTTTYGIYLQDSPEYCSILNNTCTDNYFGLYLNHCTRMVVANNTLNANTKGLYALNSNHMDIIQNNCYDCDLLGFDFYDCIWIDITLNQLTYNYQDALKLHYTQDSLICLNTFVGNDGYAVFLSSQTHDNEVYLNNFVDNAELLTSQAYDSGTDNYWYNQLNLQGNFWSDLEYLCYYELDGTAGSFDLYPLNRDADCYTTSIPSTSTSTPFAFEMLVISLVLLILVNKIKIVKKRE